MQSLVKAKIDTYATSQINGQWWIVRRTLDDSSGEVSDKPIKGPFAGEGAAECEASAMAVAAGDVIREAKRTRPLKGKKGRTSPVDKKTMAKMVTFLTRPTK